jgi:hypothetical protein
VVPTSLACIDCHAFTPLPPLPLADGTNAEDTNCITCHDRTMGTAGLGMMDQTHLSCGPPDCPVAGYTWSSTQTNFCLKCHPAGLL